MPLAVPKLTLPFLVALACTGCGGENPFLSIPVGFTETQVQASGFKQVPTEAKRGEPVRVVLGVYFPGGKCWRTQRVDTEVDSVNRTVVFKAFKSYTPIVADKYWGRACVDGPEDHEVTFTPQHAGIYSLSTSPSLSGWGLSSTATITVTD